MTTPLLSNPPPPPYGASGSESRPITEAEPAGKRFLKAFAVAALVYILVVSAFGSVIVVPDRVRVIYVSLKTLRFAFWTSLKSLSFREKGPIPEPSSSDGQTVACHLPFEPTIYSPDYGFPWPLEVNDTAGSPPKIPQGEGAVALYPPLESRTTFQLLASAPVLFFLTKGDLGEGKITFKVADDSSQAPNVVTGEIITRYASIAARNRANICTLRRDEGSFGLGIYVRISKTDRRFRANASVRLADSKGLALSRGRHPSF